MSNQPNPYDEFSRDKAYWEEYRELGFAPGSTGHFMFPALSPEFQNNEEIKKAELEARRRVYFFHRKVAVIGLLVALGMLILGVAGIGNGLTWTIFVISSFAAGVGGWEMIEPDIK